MTYVTNIDRYLCDSFVDNHILLSSLWKPHIKYIICASSISSPSQPSWFAQFYLYSNSFLFPFSELFSSIFLILFLQAFHNWLALHTTNTVNISSIYHTTNYKSRWSAKQLIWRHLPILECFFLNINDCSNIEVCHFQIKTL